MKAVIGLVERNDDLDRALSGLQAAGFSREAIVVSDNSPTLWEQVNSSFQHSVRRAASIGAGLTGAAYAAIGFSAARCAMNGGVPVLWSVSTAAMFLLIGLGLGAFVGAFMGRVEAEQETQLTLEGIRRGGVLLFVWAEDRRTREAMRILRDAGFPLVRTGTPARKARPPMGLYSPKPV